MGNLLLWAVTNMPSITSSGMPQTLHGSSTRLAPVWFITGGLSSTRRWSRMECPSILKLRDLQQRNLNLLYMMPPSKRAQIKAKIEKVLRRRYMVGSRASGVTLKSWIRYFGVPKGEFDIRIVYDGTANGLNDTIYVPSFWLPTIDSVSRALDDTSWMSSNGHHHSYCFNNSVKMCDNYRYFCRLCRLFEVQSVTSLMLFLNKLYRRINIIRAFSSLYTKY